MIEYSYPDKRKIICVYLYIIFMSGILNYEKNRDDPELIDWNRKMNREDILHDGLKNGNAPKIEGTKLFEKLLNEIYPEMYNNEPKADWMFDNLTLYKLPKVIKTTKKKAIETTIKPVQLVNIEYGIQDTFPGKKYGMKNRITPAYYLDPATRSYDNKIEGIFDDLIEFCNTNKIINKEIDLSKYGIRYLNKMIIEFEPDDDDDEDCIKITLKGSSINYDIYVKIGYFKAYCKHAEPNFELGNFEYIDEKTKSLKTTKTSYLGGNVEKNLFFDKYKNIYNKDNERDGKILLIFKLLGDLSSIIFSCDEDAVCTNDTYLRDRCIKNKVPIIFHGSIMTEKDKKSGITLTMVDENDKVSNPTTRVNGYFYIPIQDNIVQDYHLKSVTKPSKVAATKPSKVAATKPSKVASTKPSKVAATKPRKVAATKPSKVAATKPRKVAATKPSKVAATKPSKVAGRYNLPIEDDEISLGDEDSDYEDDNDEDSDYEDYNDNDNDNGEDDDESLGDEDTDDDDESLGDEDTDDDDEYGGGNNSKYNIFANGSNKENVKNYIDNYVNNLNNFLENPVFVNKYMCTNEAITYINQLIVFLNTEVKNEINKIETNQPVKEFNSKIMKWFPLDIIVETNDIIREAPKYFIPTKITKIFPELHDTIDGFANKLQMPFNKLVSKEEIKIENNYSLKDIVNYLSKKLSDLRDSDELIECKGIIEQLKKKNVIIPNDLFPLFDICVDNGFIDEDNILFEYLLYICNYDIIDAYTYCTVLMQLTYINGYYIYDYNIINNFVENIKKTYYIFTERFDGFKTFLMKHMNSETHEEIINEEINPPEILVPLPETNTQNLDINIDNNIQNRENEMIFKKFNPNSYYDNLKKAMPGREMAAGKKKRKTKKNSKKNRKSKKKTNNSKKQNKHRNKTHTKMSNTLSKKKK